MRNIQDRVEELESQIHCIETQISEWQEDLKYLQQELNNLLEDGE